MTSGMDLNINRIKCVRLVNVDVTDRAFLVPSGDDRTTRID